MRYDTRGYTLAPIDEFYVGVFPPDPEKGQTRHDYYESDRNEFNRCPREYRKIIDGRKARIHVFLVDGIVDRVPLTLVLATRIAVAFWKNENSAEFCGH